ncbi:MAG: hypothetical protein A2Y21_05305 [Clostridiales bacterium GWC2_40_7]|nr:MAG: hypothetical protein A2Y21_05305 [Clostridiales bacterium GWC2_40_7]
MKILSGSVLRRISRRRSYSSSIIKIFLSYVLILIIPLVLLISLIYFKGNDFLYMINRSMYTGVLSRTQESIYDMFDTVKELSIKMVSDEYIKKTVYNPGYYEDYKTNRTGELIDVVERINQYKLSGDFLDEIILYNANDDFVISTRGIDHLDWFFDKAYYFNNMTMKQWTTILKSNDSDILLGPLPAKYYNSSVNEIVYIKTFNFNAGRTIKTAFFINIDKISEIFNNVKINDNIIIAMLNDDNKIISASVEEEFLSPMLNKKRYNLSDEKTNSGILSDDMNNSYYYMTLKSDRGPFHMLCLIPAKLLNNANAISMYFFFFIAVVTLTGLVLCYMLARMNIKPLMGIVQAIRSKLPLNQDNTVNQDVYKYILSAISIESRNRETLTRQVNQFRQMAQYSCLIDILNGRCDSEEGIQQILSILPELDGKTAYQVAVLSPMSKCRSSIITTGILNEVDLSGGNKSYVTFYENLVLIFFLIESAESKNHVMEIMGRLVYDDTDLALTVGVGDSYDTWKMARNSFDEAKIAADYRMINSERIVYFKDIKKNKSDNIYYYPLNVELNMINCLKAGNYENARTILNGFVQENLLKGSLSAATKKCLFYNITATVFKILNEMEESSYMTGKFENDLESIFTLEELYNYVDGIFKKICENQLNSRESRNTHLCDEIIAYININYNDPNLSLVLLADKFNLSQSYLSRFIKDQIGYSFSEYIAMKRVDKAKTLLNEGHAVNVVSQMVGYNKVLAFRRAFKSQQGVTPGALKSAK